MGDKTRTLANAARQTALAALGARLRAARVRAGFTQEEVAGNLEVSTQSVRNWEAGRTEPSAERLRRMSVLYDVPTVQLETAALAPGLGALTPKTFNRVNVDPRKLVLARVQANFTRAKAGVLSGVSESSIARYERGEMKPRPDRLLALAAAYQKPAKWFVADTEGEGADHEEVSTSICEQCSTPIDHATIAYATAHPQLSVQAVHAISEFIAFVHQREIRLIAPELRANDGSESTK